VPLPKDIQAVKSRHGNCVYYYYTPGRGTKNPGKRVFLGKDIVDPEFWRRLRDAKNEPTANAGTFAALIDTYKQSKDWQNLRPATKTGLYSLPSPHRGCRRRSSGSRAQSARRL
jgi:hypothetical protein